MRVLEGEDAVVTMLGVCHDYNYTDLYLLPWGKFSADILYKPLACLWIVASYWSGLVLFQNCSMVDYLLQLMKALNCELCSIYTFVFLHWWNLICAKSEMWWYLLRFSDSRCLVDIYVLRYMADFLIHPCFQFFSAEREIWCKHFHEETDGTLKVSKGVEEWKNMWMISLHNGFLPICWRIIEMKIVQSHSQEWWKNCNETYFFPQDSSFKEIVKVLPSFT